MVSVPEENRVKREPHRVAGVISETSAAVSNPNVFPVEGLSALRGIAPANLVRPMVRGNASVNVHDSIYLLTDEAQELYFRVFPEAADANTTPQRLRALYIPLPSELRTPQRHAYLKKAPESGNLREAVFAILDALAANPNTPPDILAEIAGRHPDAFAINPILPLLPLEEPGFVDTATGLLDSLRSVHAPASLVRLLRLSSRPDYADEARFHIAVAGEVQEDEDWKAALQAYLLGIAERRPLSSYAPRRTTMREWLERLQNPEAGPYRVGRGEKSPFFAERLAAAQNPVDGLLARAAADPSLRASALAQEPNRFVRALYRESTGS